MDIWEQIKEGFKEVTDQFELLKEELSYSIAIGGLVIIIIAVWCIFKCLC